MLRFPRSILSLTSLGRAWQALVGDEAIDGGLEIDDAFEEAALEAPLGEDGEETLDSGAIIPFQGPSA
jgi:hypothetical protein